MLLLQFQFTNITTDELNIIPEFCNWLCDQIYTKINTSINRRKIQLRLKYLYNCSWIHWSDKKFNTGVLDIMEAIYDSLTYTPYKNNLWKIHTDINIRIPNSYTAVDRLIRFLNYGDTYYKATGIFTKLQKEFNHQKLNSLWKIYVMNRLGIMSSVKIISE